MNSAIIEFLPSPVQDSNGRAVGVKVAIVFGFAEGLQRLIHRGKRFRVSVVYDSQKITIENAKLSPWVSLSQESQLGGTIGASLSPVGPTGSLSIQRSTHGATVREWESKRGANRAYNFEGKLPPTKGDERTVLTIEFGIHLHATDGSLPVWVEVNWLGVTHHCHLSGTISTAPPVQNSKPIAEVKDHIAISPYFFERLNVPAFILEGDGLYEYSDGKHSMVECRWQPQPEYTLNEFPEELRNLCNKVLAEKQEIADRRAQVFFNGHLARLIDYRPIRRDIDGYRGLQLRLQPTNYYTFVATNHALESSHAEEAKQKGLVKTEISSISNLRDSLLANPITVTINIITEEPDGTERLIVQKRNPNKVMHCWQKWQAGAAGMVNMPPDTTAAIPNPFFTAAVHEIQQETGLEVSAEQVVFLALVRETRFFEVGLLGEVHVKQSYRKILSDIADPFESEEFKAIPFTAQDFVTFLREVGNGELVSQGKTGSMQEEIREGVKAYVPLALAAALISLVHNCGSSRMIEDAFKK